MAAQAFTEAIERAPGCPETLTGLAALSIELEAFDGALDLYTRLIYARPRDPGTAVEHGLPLQKISHFDDAI